MAFISPRRDQEIIPIALKRTPNMPAAKHAVSISEHGAKPQRPETARRSHSTGEAGGSSNNNAAALHNQKVDRFGFITNIDSNGRILPTSGNDVPEVGSEADVKRNERREKKWNNMMQSWDTTNKRRQRLILNRLRKGLPDTMRGKVWPLLGGVNKKLREGSSTKGIYKALLRQCEEENQNALDHMPPEGPNHSKAAGLSLMVRSNSFQNIQETIERDIHRTFPRHSLFYDEENHRDDLPPPKPPPKEQKEASNEFDEDDSHHNLGALCNEDLSALMQELDVGASPFEDKKKKKKGTKSDGNDNIPGPSPLTKAKSTTCETMLFQAKGGQPALRRVLCAYSYYDRDVGYCQGMNFIAAMFITIMPEEQAFWMLVGKSSLDWK